MKQLTQNFKNGKLKIEEVPVPVIKGGGVIVRNYVSLISAGTDKLVTSLAEKSLAGKAKERPDLVKQVLDKVKSEGIVSTFRKVMGQLDTPMPLGYSCAGVVEEVGGDTDEFQVGDRVACAGNRYANHAEMIFVPKNLCAKIPDNVEFDDAAFVTLGAIALQGVRQAVLTLGERVAVVGLGLVGQLTVQLVKAAGCQVLGIDLDANKVKLVKELGADISVLRNDDVNGVVAAFTQGHGVDAVIITAAAESNDPVELAGGILRDKGRVVVVGVVKMDVPRRTYYEKELDLRLSRSYGPGRYDAIYEEKGVDYPFGYVRWTEKRNMEAFLQLVAEGKINVKPLITHRFPFERALEAYDLILGKTPVGSGVKPPNNSAGKTQETYLAVLFQYDTEKELEKKVILQTTADGKRDSLKTEIPPNPPLAKGGICPSEGEFSDNSPPFIKGRTRPSSNEKFSDNSPRFIKERTRSSSDEAFSGSSPPFVKGAGGISESSTSHYPVKSTTENVSIGVIGAGNFAKGVLLPHLKQIAGAQIRAIATATGLSARHVGQKFAAEYVTSDYNEILTDPNIDAVLIATRHDLHAQLVIEGLKQGKAIFVEKPLAISQEELDQIIEVQQEANGRVMVGFNRRFSPLAIKVNQFFANRKGPICIIYRVNAGFVPKDHWTQDEKQGGGRIIGEVCHFVDLMQYLTDSVPQTIFAQPIRDATGALIPQDNVMITLQFENGSIGTISYLSNGDVAYGKERVEIFGDGAVALIDDFKRAEISHKGKRRKFGGNLLAGQQKGHREELETFVETIRNRKPLPIPFVDSVITTQTTFKIIESIRCQRIIVTD